MANDLTDTGAQYSSVVGLVYVFNLIVGTGALTIPHAFAQAGWLLSLILVIALAFMSYLTATFVIESMASTNAIRKWNHIEQFKQSYSVNGSVYVDENQPLLGHSSSYEDEVHPNANDYYAITERIEMGKMASIFFNKVGLNLFYISLIVYLYGDLAIYAAAVPKSLRNAACTWSQLTPLNGTTITTCNDTLQDSDPCWPGVALDRGGVYRICLAAFTVLMGPFLFFNAQKTKYLQLFTTLNRWLAFGMMISLAVIRLSKGEGEGRPKIANFAGVPTLFGVCIYSFMCHHSLPSLVTPIRNKSRLTRLFAGDYILILIFYSLLAFTGIFCFSELQDLYTLNFEPNSCDTNNNPITTIKFFQYYLALFPVFTLSTNFPIIGITLRNNLKSIVYKDGVDYHWALDRLFFPLAALLPPVGVAFITNRVGLLVSITGSYAGVAIQYVVPVALVIYSRRAALATLGESIENKHISPFKHWMWAIGVLVWAVLCVSFVTINHIITKQ